MGLDVGDDGEFWPTCEVRPFAVRGLFGTNFVEVRTDVPGLKACGIESGQRHGFTCVYHAADATFDEFPSVARFEQSV